MAKIKPETRYNKLRSEMIVRFNDDESMMTDFMMFVKGSDTRVDLLASKFCDESGNLDLNSPSTFATVYYLLRIANKPVLLRDLEKFSLAAWNNVGKTALYIALFFLYSINLIDYELRDFRSTPSNVIQFFIKEDD